MPKKINIELPKNQKFFSRRELNNRGISYYAVNRMVAEGSLLRLSAGIFENPYYVGEESDYYYVSAYVPDGVLCLLSAAKYYGLTNYWPDTIDVAIERTKKAGTLPDWPNIHVLYFSQKRYEMGIDQINENSNYFKIYNIEKTIADILFYRNKIGIEETKEILVSYLRRSDRNLNRLHRYAKELQCEKILRTYLEVLL